MSDQAPYLHLRSQATYHAEARIAGNVHGLEALRDAIDQAIANREADCLAFAADGEGYNIQILRCRRIEDMGSPPYLDDLGRAIANTELAWLIEKERSNRDYWLTESNKIRAANYRGRPMLAADIGA